MMLCVRLGNKKPLSSVTALMTTAAKRARKKANRARRIKLTPGEAAQLEEALTTPSEHAAAVTALAKFLKMQKKLRG